MIAPGDARIPPLGYLSTGDLAVYDGFAGLLTCRILYVAHDSDWPSTGAGEITVRLTIKRPTGRSGGGYRPGEVIHTNGLHIVHRGAIHRRIYGVTLSSGYGFKAGGVNRPEGING